MNALSPSQLAIKCLHGYRYILSPWVGNQCRFYPTCSHYAEEAIGLYGLTKGSYLTVRRLLKCHPWHPGGLDPVMAPTIKPINETSVDQNLRDASLQFQQPKDGSQ